MPNTGCNEKETDEDDQRGVPAKKGQTVRRDTTETNKKEEGRMKAELKEHMVQARRRA